MEAAARAREAEDKEALECGIYPGNLRFRCLFHSLFLGTKNGVVLLLLYGTRMIFLQRGTSPACILAGKFGFLFLSLRNLGIAVFSGLLGFYFPLVTFLFVRNEIRLMLVFSKYCVCCSSLVAIALWFFVSSFLRRVWEWFGLLISAGVYEALADLVHEIGWVG